jgi:hypothetical protein
MALSAEAAELAAVVTMVLTTSPVPTCPAIDMVSITLDSIYRNPQLRGVRLLLVCDGTKVVESANAYRSGKVTAEAQQRYIEYKANLRAEIAALRYPCVAPHGLTRGPCWFSGRRSCFVCLVRLQSVHGMGSKRADGRCGSHLSGSHYLSLLASVADTASSCLARLPACPPACLRRRL